MGVGGGGGGGADVTAACEEDPEPFGRSHDTVADTSIRTAPAISTRLLRGEDIGTIRPSIARQPNHPSNRPAIWPPAFGTGIMPASTIRGGWTIAIEEEVLAADETLAAIVTDRLKLTLPPVGIAIGGLKL